jgi:hypothetical protein
MKGASKATTDSEEKIPPADKPQPDKKVHIKTKRRKEITKKNSAFSLRLCAFA